MHYGDDQQLKHSELVLGIYKHTIAGRPSAHHLVTVASIQSCKYFNPYIVIKLLKEPHKLLRKILLNQPLETWLEVKFKQTDKKPYWQVESVKAADLEADPFTGLH